MPLCKSLFRMCVFVPIDWNSTNVCKYLPDICLYDIWISECLGSSLSGTRRLLKRDRLSFVRAVQILSRNQPPWFHLCGVPCTKGTKVRVLMENGEWYVGEIDAYSRKNDKVRLKFPQDFLGLVHAPLQQLSIEPVTKEEQPTALSSQSLSSWFASDQSQDILGADKDLNRLSGSSVGLAEADNHEASAVSANSMLVSDVVGPVDTPRSRCCVTLESGFKGILQEQGQGLSQSISREQFIDRAQGAENGNRLCQHFLVEDAGADSLKSKQSEHPVYNPASQQRERASGAKSIVVRVASIPSEDAGCHGF